MHLKVIDGFTAGDDQTSSHSIPTLQLKILDDSLLIEGHPRYVFVFDNDQLIGEACIVVKDIAFIGNVWVHPDHRKSLVLFKMLKKLLEFANLHQVYEYEAHVRDYTPIKPDAYTGRLGIPFLEESGVFYEYFIAASPSALSSFNKKLLPSTQRSKIIQHFYDDNVSIIVEDYDNAYQSFDQNNKCVKIGHVTQWKYNTLENGIEPLKYVSQFYDYLNFKSDVSVCEHFNIAKMYKTSIFKNLSNSNIKAVAQK